MDRGLKQAKSAALLAILSVAQLFTPAAAHCQELTTLYNFQGPPNDGLTPGAGVTLDRSGNMYGTTQAGGEVDGALFELSPEGRELLLLSVGGTPDAKLAPGPDGALYGTAPFGGADFSGTVFRLRGTTLSVVHQFLGSPDGLGPDGGVVENVDGNLYGTTAQGGTGGCAGGCGTIYKIDQAGHEAVVYSFDGPDGAFPGATLIHDQEGNLYGTTSGGGNTNQWYPYGLGTVSVFSSSGNYTVLHKFTYGTTDGFDPPVGVVRDPLGNLYGTTISGGLWNYGTIYEVSRTGEEKVL